MSCVQFCGALEDLVMDDVGIPDTVLRAMAEHCPLLRRLSLKNASFTAKGIHVLLKQASQLRELVVSANCRAVNELSVILIEENYPHLKVIRNTGSTPMPVGHTAAGFHLDLFDEFDAHAQFTDLFDETVMADFDLFT